MVWGVKIFNLPYSSIFRVHYKAVTGWYCAPQWLDISTQGLCLVITLQLLVSRMIDSITLSVSNPSLSSTRSTPPARNGAVQGWPNSLIQISRAIVIGLLWWWESFWSFCSSLQRIANNVIKLFLISNCWFLRYQPPWASVAEERILELTRVNEKRIGELACRYEFPKKPWNWWDKWQFRKWTLRWQVT